MNEWIKDNAIKFYSFKTKAERSNPEVKEKLASEKKIKKREIDEITSPIANHPNELVMPECVSGGEGHLDQCDSGDKTCGRSRRDNQSEESFVKSWKS